MVGGGGREEDTLRLKEEEEEEEGRSLPAKVERDAGEKALCVRVSRHPLDLEEPERNITHTLMERTHTHTLMERAQTH